MTFRRLRSATPGDGNAVAAIYRPIVEETAISFEFEAPSGLDMGRRIAETVGRGDPWLVLEVDGLVAGYSYASAFRSRPAYGATKETTVYVAPSRQGQGVGAELLAALLAELQTMAVHVAVAGITLPNEASIGLHERLGFTPAGVIPEVGLKFGRWHDLGFWHRKL